MDNLTENESKNELESGSVELMDGKACSRKLEISLKEKISKAKVVRGRAPHLSVVLVGDHGPSLVYISQKRKACERVGIDFSLHHLSNAVSEASLLALIEEMNCDNGVDGMIVQLPLPKHIDSRRVMEAIDYRKDVDGFHPMSVGRLMLGELDSTFIAATPYGIKLLLDEYGVDVKGKHVVVVGKSQIVGQPLANLLSLEKGMAGTVTICDRYTKDLAGFTRSADVLVVAAGVHHLIRDGMVKKGAVVIDVGIHQISDSSKKAGYHLEGDVDFDAVSGNCRLITPVPGGVGPMTVVSLLLNTWKAYSRQ